MGIDGACAMAVKWPLTLVTECHRLWKEACQGTKDQAAARKEAEAARKWEAR